MTQLKYPTKPITKAQIKKIHALVNGIGMIDEHYRALLYRFNVESSTELNRQDAKEFIGTLIDFEKEIKRVNNLPQTTGIYTSGRVVYFSRKGKATNAQLDYIFGMWKQIATKPDYKSLMTFIKRVTKKFYLHIESIDVKEASSVIVALEKWLDKKVKND